MIWQRQHPLARASGKEAKYRQCLALDPNDDKAQAELNHIKRLRDK